MIFWTIGSILYAIIAVFSIYMTRQEQKRQERPSLVFNLIGYLACIAWPLAVAAIYLDGLRRPTGLMQG